MDNAQDDSTLRPSAFTKEVLRDIFSLHEDTPCYTHTILGCTCDTDDPVRNTIHW